MKGQITPKSLVLVIVMVILIGFLLDPLKLGIGISNEAFGEGSPGAFINMFTILLFSFGGFYYLGRAGSSNRSY